MKSGTRAARHLYKEKEFHNKFGGTTALLIPDFDLDSGLNGMPDQERDNAPTECTGYTVADIVTDISKVKMNPDFSYAAALFIDGQPPGINGASFHAAMQSAIAVGVLPNTLANISAGQSGELFVSDWTRWGMNLKKAARDYTENGILNALGNGDAFDSIASAAYTSKIGISVGTPWFTEWKQNINNGVVGLPVLDPNGNYSTWHNWAIKKKVTIQGVPYLAGKSWQGERVGDKGWLYFSRETVNAALSVPGTGALAFNPEAIRWWSIVGILVQRFPVLLSSLPQLIHANG